MSLYASLDDLKTARGEDVLFVLAPGADRKGLNTSAVQAGLERATREADSYLSVRYRLPLARIDAVLSGVVMDMALYHVAGDANRMTEVIATRYKAAVKWLEQVSAGRATLPGAEQPDNNRSAPRPVVIAGPVRVFRRTQMKGL